MQVALSEDLDATKSQLAAVTARAVAAEEAAEAAEVEKAASLDAERQAKAELQLRLDEIEEGTAEMEKLLEENEVRSHPIGRSIAIKHKRARPHSTDWLCCAVSCCVVLWFICRTSSRKTRPTATESEPCLPPRLRSRTVRSHPPHVTTRPLPCSSE